VGLSADVGETVTEQQITHFLKENAATEIVGEAAAAQASSLGATVDDGENAPRAMPNVRSHAKQLGVDLAELSRVTGKTGLISKQDVEDFAAAQGESGSQTSPVLPRLQTTMAKRMSQSWLVPQFTQDMEIEISGLRAKRARLAAEGLKISFAALILDALTQALRDVPACNGIYENDTFIPGAAVHAGIAVSTSDGLVVPVLKNCEAMDLTQRSQELDALVQRARAGKLMPDETSGATVTLSMLNKTRVETGTPILNAPQVCLLFCGAPTPKPVVKDGAVVVGETMHLVSVYDHRVIDGMTGARFMDALHTYISQP
ncbi:MAG TPA: dihydrolipoamide acetyltransferase family protein, partial [Rhizomicrobium sp.]|nr:dihydrolipoamide acetyltransferase family protein [Rhizomicrobium sp.]